MEKGVEVAAWAARKAGSWEPVAGATAICGEEAGVIGAAVLEMLPKCVAREMKGRKGGSGKGAGASATVDSGDLPVSFGYKASWVAVPTADAAALAEIAGLHDLQRCSWKDGIERGYRREGVFISPTIATWTLAMGLHPDVSQDTFGAYLKKLSEGFGEAYYFGTHRIVGYHAWAKAKAGKIVRAFGYLGERGEFLVNIGERTADEIELGAGLVDDESAPNEETVLELASKWVLDPRELETYEDANGPGWFGVRNARQSDI
jgi:hypothetical protein